MLMAIKQLSFRYGRQTVLRDVNAELNRGEVVALVGANGSGKTTLMQIMLGDLRPQQGEVVVDAALYAGQSIAYLPDKPPLYPDWTVREFLLRLADERKAGRTAVEEVIQRCALQTVQNKLCRELSHGYRQRASLAQALLHHPKVLFMDEPMNGLDDVQRNALRSMVKALAAEGMVVLLSLHDLDDVTAIAQRVWYLQNGKLFDLPLTDYEGIAMWAVFSSAATAGEYDCAVREGNVCGFSLSELEHCGSQLLRDASLQSLGRQYPSVALMARMAACW